MIWHGTSILRMKGVIHVSSTICAQADFGGAEGANSTGPQQRRRAGHAAGSDDSIVVGRTDDASNRPVMGDDKRGGASIDPSVQRREFSGLGGSSAPGTTSTGRPALRGFTQGISADNPAGSGLSIHVVDPGAAARTSGPKNSHHPERDLPVPAHGQERDRLSTAQAQHGSPARSP